MDRSSDFIGKCLHVGIFDGEEYSEPDEGTVQGSVLSPLLGNVYLHHVLDVWFARDVLPRLRGEAHLVRYADDAVFAFEREDDATRVMGVLAKRLERYGLSLHPEKTRLLPHKRPARSAASGRSAATFDFLGFTHYWGRARSGHWTPRVKTRKARLRRVIVTVNDWFRSHRHLPVKEQHAALTRRISGYFNYFAVNGNVRCIRHVHRLCGVVWHKWLNRRSQRSKMSWARFNALLRVYPLPDARIRVQLWK